MNITIGIRSQNGLFPYPSHVPPGMKFEALGRAPVRCVAETLLMKPSAEASWLIYSVDVRPALRAPAREEKGTPARITQAFGRESTDWPLAVVADDGISAALLEPELTRFLCLSDQVIEAGDLVRLTGLNMSAFTFAFEAVLLCRPAFEAYQDERADAPKPSG